MATYAEGRRTQICSTHGTSRLYQYDTIDFKWGISYSALITRRVYTESLIIIMLPSKLAALRHLLHEMEQELGLDGLSPVQRDVLYAAHLLSANSDTFSTAQLRRHAMVLNVPKPTFFRVLKTLQENGYIIQGGDAAQGIYSLGPNATK